MVKRISKTLYFAKSSVTNTFSTLIKDERGLSGVVVAILLILVAVLAIVLIWAFLGEWLVELWEQIVSEADGL